MSNDVRDGQVASGDAIPTKTKLGRKMDRKHCVGCSENFYNGNNSLGVSECWNLKTAKVITRKMVASDQPPPWNQPSQKLPSCYRRKGYAIMNGSPKGWDG